MVDEDKITTETAEKAEKAEETVKTISDPNHLDSLIGMSQEVLLLILSFLEIRELGRMAQVSTLFARISQDNQLWQRFLPKEVLETNLEQGALKRKRKNMEFFKQFKRKYLEKYKSSFTTPIASYKKSYISSKISRTLWDDFIAIVEKGTKEEWHTFIKQHTAAEIFKDTTNSYENLQNLVLASMNNTNYREVLKAVITFLNTNSPIDSGFLEFKGFHWIMLKCFEKQCPPILIHGVHPIFNAIIKNHAEIVEFFVAYQPKCLEEKNNNFSGNTPIEVAFKMQIKEKIPRELALSLILPSYLQNKKLLTDFILRKFLYIHSFLNMKVFLEYLHLFDLKNLSDDYFTFLFNFFLKKDCDLNSENFSSLLEFAKDIINLQRMTYNNATLLHKSVELGRFDLCEVLLKKGANPNLVDNGGYTVLHYLISSNFSQEIVAKAISFLPILINTYKADPTIPNKEQNTPIDITIVKNKKVYFINLLEFAHDTMKLQSKIVAFGRFELCKILLERGVDPNLVDKKGNTLLHLLALNVFTTETEGKLKSLLPLLINTYKASLTISNNSKETFLQTALKNHRTFILKIFIKYCKGAEFISEDAIREHYKDVSKHFANFKYEKGYLLNLLRKRSVAKMDQSTQTDEDEHNECKMNSSLK